MGRSNASPQAGRAWFRPVVCWLALAVVSAAGCGMPGSQQGGGTGPGKRAQPLVLSPEEELEIGRQAYREVMRKYEGRILPGGDPEVRRVRGICERLLRASSIPPLQREINLSLRGYRFQWEVNVVRDESVNAFSLPGGKMVVFTGILPVAEDEGQLAAVLSHEIAHVLAHHANERVARKQGSGAWRFFGDKSYDRMQESEADHIGVFLMAFADYNPDAAVRFWERMQQHSGGARRPEILSDHPSDARRIHDLREWAPRARAAKRAFDEGRILKSP